MADFMRIVRLTFLCVNGAFLVFGIGLLIYGMVKPVEGYATGGFIGGFLSALATALLAYSGMGLWAAYKLDRQLLLIYGGLAAASLVSRVITWISAAIHYYVLRWDVYFGLVLEIFLIIMSLLMNNYITGMVGSSFTTTTVRTGITAASNGIRPSV